MRKIVLHNHFPKARDVNAFEHALPREKEEENRRRAYAATGIKPLGKNLDEDPDYQKWAEEQRKKQNEGGGSFHDRARDDRVTKPLKEDGKWWFTSRRFGANGQEIRKTYGPFASTEEANSKRKELLAKPEFRR